MEHAFDRVHAGAGGHHAQRLDLDHVPPGSQHDAHVAARHAKHALTPSSAPHSSSPPRRAARLIFLAVLAFVLFAVVCPLGLSVEERRVGIGVSLLCYSWWW